MLFFDQSSKIVLISLLLNCASLLFACSQKHTSKIGWIKQAPRNSVELGFIVRGLDSTKVQSWLETNPGVGARELDLSTGLYELHGSSESQLRQSFHSSKIEVRPNHLVRIIVEDQQSYSGQGMPPFIHKEITHSEEANRFSTGRGVTVAVIDTGVNFSHPDLQGQEMLSSQGYDFIDGDEDPRDENMHGTAAAGLIAGLNSGIAPGTRILALRAFDANGLSDVGSVEAAIAYAIRAKVDIINASFGFYRKHTGIAEQVNRSEKSNILFVAAAGNDGMNTDHFINIPATLPNLNILSVAALQFDGWITSYSNFGTNSVDIGAPVGTMEQGIYTTSFRPEDSLYIEFGGTSAAAPIVSGVAALAKSRWKFKSAVDLRNHLIRTGTELQFLRSKIQFPIRIDAYGAVTKDVQ